MGFFSRKDEVKLFEYIDDVATKVACTYVGLLVPDKKIQDEDLRQLADDKIKSAAAIFAICCRQAQALTERKKESILPILLQRTIYHLTGEIFSNNSGEDNEQKVTMVFNTYFESYYPLSTDIFKLFSKFTEELNLINPSGNQLVETMQITETVTNYMTRTKVNEFSKNINKLA